MKKVFLIFILVSICCLSQSQQSVSLVYPPIRVIDSVACTEVKDQSNSPTCWVFGTNSLFESDIMKTSHLKLDLSEMFIARYAYIDKTNKFLESGGKTYCDGGGQFHDVIRIVNNYGMVPEQAYSGKLRGQQSHNHRGLDTAMKRLRMQWLRQGKTSLDAYDIKRLNDTLDHYLGKVPQIFWYDMKPYTPKTFAKEVAQFANDYVELMSFADLPYYKKCLLKDKFNWAGDSLYNIPLEDLQMIVDSALAKGWSLGWEGDVTESGFDYFGGYVTENDTIQNFEEQRLVDFKTEKTERDHMLHLVGMGIDDNNNKWYYLKNSWGTWMSHFHGFIYMSSDYFKQKTVVLMLNRSALPKSVLEKLGLVKN